MTRAFVSVGSNILPAENVRRALKLLAVRARLVGISTFYRTAPLGRPEQEDYYNGVAEIETPLPPLALRDEVLRAIEAELGRVRGADRYAPRTIDLDLIAYGNIELKAEGLVLPDPEIARRPFLAIPLAELAPTLAFPALGGSAREIATEIALAGMEALHEYTEELRKELMHGDEPGTN